MSDSQKQRWFMVSEPVVQNTHYVCCAETYEQAVKSFGGFAQGRNIIQLTWRQLSELTGCLIPCQSKPKNYANGKLMFNRKGNFITIW